MAAEIRGGPGSLRNLENNALSSLRIVTEPATPASEWGEGVNDDLKFRQASPQKFKPLYVLKIHKFISSIMP